MISSDTLIRLTWIWKFHSSYLAKIPYQPKLKSAGSGTTKILVNSNQVSEEMNLPVVKWFFPHETFTSLK